MGQKVEVEGTEVKQAGCSSPCRRVWTELERNGCSTTCRKSGKMERSRAVTAKNEEQICTREGGESTECCLYRWQEGC